MKNLLVYLHGFGYDKNENLEFQKKLAKELNADLLGIDATEPSGRERGGFAWFPIVKDPNTNAIEAKFDKNLKESEIRVKKIISEELEKSGRSWNDVILIGRSQGAFLSLYIGLKLKNFVNAIVPIAGFFDESAPNIEINNNSKVIWIETKYDNVLNDERKSSYKILEKKGINLKYILDENSDHDILEDSIVDIIKENI